MPAPLADPPPAEGPQDPGGRPAVPVPEDTPAPVIPKDRPAPAEPPPGHEPPPAVPEDDPPPAGDPSDPAPVEPPGEKPPMRMRHLGTTPGWGISERAPLGHGPWRLAPVAPAMIRGFSRSSASKPGGTRSANQL